MPGYLRPPVLKMGRLLIVGWDSADFSLVDPLLKAGRLPNLAKLIEGGVRGPLESTFHPNSFPGWSSFMTGTDPGQHGLLYPVIARGNSYVPSPVRSTDIKVRRMWDYLSDAGKDLVVVNVPVTYPAEPLRGAMVTGILTPDLEHQWTYPGDLAGEILENVGEYVIDARHDWKEKARTWEETKRCMRLRKQTALYLMRSRPWDVFCVVFTSLDRVQHCFWGDRDPKHPGHNPSDAGKYGGVIDGTYEILDSYLGELVEEAGEGVDVMVVSDHGSGPLYHNCRVNVLLAQSGLLVMKEGPGRGNLLRGLAAKASTLVNDVVEKLKARPRTLEEKVGTFAQKLDHHSESMRLLTNRVDWSRTTAFFTSEGGIRLNIRGREPRGIVEPEDRDGAMARVREALMACRDPVNGGPLFKDLPDARDILKGPEAHNAPDIYPIFTNAHIRPIKNLEPRRVLTPEMSGAGFHDQHFRAGVFAAGGPSIRKGEVEGARLLDIAPTVLHMMGEGVPRHMDGRVLRIFSKGSDAGSRRPKPVDAPVTPAREVFSQSREDDEIITDRLRGLGYI